MNLSKRIKRIKKKGDHKVKKWEEYIHTLLVGISEFEKFKGTQVLRVFWSLTHTSSTFTI